MRKRVPLDESGDPTLGEVALDDDGGGSLGRREQRPLERRETDAGDHAASEAEKTRPLVRGEKLLAVRARVLLCEREREETPSRIEPRDLRGARRRREAKRGRRADSPACRWRSRVGRWGCRAGRWPLWERRVEDRPMT